MPAPARQRLNELIEKRQANRISPAELEELIQLTDQAEEIGGEQLQCLMELARATLRSIN